jgi:putative sugar O-methyltransferase
MLAELGPSSLIDDLSNGVRVWSLKESNTENNLETGSISGMDGSYLRIVKLAATTDKYFSKFKSNRQYREILEHVNREQGFGYLKVIEGYNSAEVALTEFCKQDVSKPFRYSYRGLGRVSPTNLRYAKVALDLKALFGSLELFEVAEIGVGYGGQCLAISCQSIFKSYTLFDLPQVVTLSRKYLGKLGVNLSCIESGDIGIQKHFDLVLSNYAFSELTRELQELYLTNVILNSQRGYLIYNDISTGDFDTMRIDEFVSRIPGALVLEEVPLTHSKNKLVVWGADSISRLAQ